MNAKRIASLLRQIGSLQLELADAYEQTEPKRKASRKVESPATEQDKATTEAARRALRKAGFAA